MIRITAGRKIAPSHTIQENQNGRHTYLFICLTSSFAETDYANSLRAMTTRLLLKSINLIVFT